MKRLTIDPDTLTIIKLGLASCTFEMIRDILLFTLGATAILSLACESKEEN